MFLFRSYVSDDAQGLAASARRETPPLTMGISPA
jgi:hypothetical protein